MNQQMQLNIIRLKAALGEKAIEHEELGKHTTFKVGGPADLYYEARTKDELLQAIQLAIAHNVPVFVMGGGTNILIGDGGIRGLVVRNLTMDITIRGIKAEKKDGVNSRVVFVEADSGVPINKLVRFTIEEGLAGLEMQLGLPGSVGGAVYMNSKWTHPEGYVGDPLYQATIIDSNGQIKTVSRDYFRFAYDFSTIQKSKDIVLSAVFALKSDDKEHLWNIANSSISYRRETQPQGVFSAGCTFKNITHAQALVASTPNLTTSAGFLVDNVGLKGKIAGKAQISPIHANFIINLGGATAKDVVKLIDTAKQAVFEKFGVMLEEEIVRVGEY